MAECLVSQIRGFVPSPAGNGEHSRHLSRQDTCFIRLIFLRSRFFIKPRGVNNSYCTCGRLGEHHPDTPSWKGLLPMWVAQSAAGLQLSAPSGSSFTGREASPRATPFPGSPHLVTERGRLLRRTFWRAVFLPNLSVRRYEALWGPHHSFTSSFAQWSYFHLSLIQIHCIPIMGWTVSPQNSYMLKP